ncbi:MAG: T9SS type A sorting domain-containing protein [Prevotella sp.]|nr:T9SS type A sorting domain-containing protein [Prevotella sp.]
MIGVPVVSYSFSAIEIVENDFQTIAVSINESTLHVTGANGQTLYIYNVAGVRVMSIKVEGADKYYELNLPKGCYIVKVGKVVRKISIK